MPDALNPLEIALDRARADPSAMPSFLRLFAGSAIIVPSAGEVMPDGSGFEPLLFGKDGVPMVACFTAAERIGRHAELAPYALTMAGGAFLRRIPADHGLVVNPGQPLGFDVAPSGLKRIVADFA